MATTADTTEDARRELAATMPAELFATIMAGEDYWDTAEMRELFTVEGFAAPFVIVRRKSDNTQGTLMFTASPRFYFGWVAD